MRHSILLALFVVAGCAAPVNLSIGQSNDAGTAAQLRAEVARSGMVRVVVTLVIAGAQPSADAIGAAQERLLAALAGTRFESVHRFQNVPQLALTARSDALEALLASPLVASVAVDALMGTMTPATSR